MLSSQVSPEINYGLDMKTQIIDLAARMEKYINFEATHYLSVGIRFEASVMCTSSLP